MRKGYGDSIKIKVDTGYNSAGNGGDGGFYGKIINKAKIDFDGDNKVEKAHVGDDVHQINKVWADQSVNVDASGGNGGHGNTAYGGEVTITLTDVNV